MTIGELQPPFSLESLPSRRRRTAAARRIYAMLTDLYLEAHNKPSTLGREFLEDLQRESGVNRVERLDRPQGQLQKGPP